MHVALLVFNGSARAIDVESDFSCHTVDGQVAGHLQLPRPNHIDLLRLERHGRVFLSVEKVGATQIFVAAFLIGVDGAHIDRRVNSGLAGVSRIVLHASGDFAERAFHVRDHHVAHRELRRRMVGINCPAVVLSGGNGGERENGNKAQSGEESRPDRHEFS